MTELFGRLAPGATLEAARAELTAVHAAMMREHPEAYSAKANIQLSVTPLRDQIAAPARTILLVLLAAAAVVFVIACSNVANLILARSVRREGELAVRAALGASHGALRRTLLAESLVLCGAGAVLGVLLARPLVAVVARYRRALLGARARGHRRRQPALGRRRPGDGRGRAARVRPAAAVAARARPASGWRAAASGSRRAPTAACASSRRRRSRSRSCCSPAPACCSPRSSPCRRRTPATTCGRCWRSTSRRRSIGIGDAKEIDFYQEVTRRIGELPGVEGVALGSFVPWRDAGSFGPGFPFTVEGYTPADGEENPHARLRIVAPGFFAVLGVPIVAGRDFTDEDRRGSEPVVIVSQSVAQRLFPERRRRRTGSSGGPIRIFGKPQPRRIVGVVADVDDENVVRGPALTIYHPVQQMRRRRPPVRARGGRSVRARAAGDARSSARCRRTSRWSAPRRSRTCARKCWRRSG